MKEPEFRKSLMRWYFRCRRSMPWRSRPGRLADPYAVLVSEAMLQQTQVATVEDYYRRFMRRWPSLADLAGAEEQQVLRAWQGLGYYRRALHLHRLARQVMAEHDGRLPDTVERLQRLPGVGRYTAGAIASIAFGRREPVVDGNVGRVLARLEARADPLDRPDVRRWLWRRAGQLLPQRSRRYTAGDFNQAMMELGAVVCTPRSPRCDRCPVRRYCRARRLGMEGQLPVAGRGPRVRSVRWVVMAVERGGRYLFEQRGRQGLWAGMWQMPSMEQERQEVDLAGWLAGRWGLQVRPVEPVGRFVHQTTHRRMTFEVYRAAVSGGRLKRGQRRWCRLDDLDELALPRPQQKAVAMLVQ